MKAESDCCSHDILAGAIFDTFTFFAILFTTLRSKASLKEVFLCRGPAGITQKACRGTVLQQQ